MAEFAITLILNPSQTAAYVSMGQVYFGDGRYGESEEASRRALALDPQQKEARYVLAASLVRLGRTDEGASELRVFQRLQAEDAAEKSRQFELGALRREAAIAAAGQDHQKSAALLGKAALLDGNSPAAHLDLGFALTQAGKHSEAIGSFTKAAALGADYEVYRHLLIRYVAAGRADESRKARALYEQLKQQALRAAGARR